MPIRVTIETNTKADAELIAGELPVEAEAHSWRGFGVIRLAVKGKDETQALVEAVSCGFREHRLQWARIRWDDEERVFRANGHRASG
jgi:hypothetical protein